MTHVKFRQDTRIDVTLLVVTRNNLLTSPEYKQIKTFCDLTSFLNHFSCYVIVTNRGEVAGIGLVRHFYDRPILERGFFVTFFMNNEYYTSTSILSNVQVSNYLIMIIQNTNKGQSDLTSSWPYDCTNNQRLSTLLPLLPRYTVRHRIAILPISFSYISRNDFSNFPIFSQQKC